jgi:hypothetical protein
MVIKKETKFSIIDENYYYSFIVETSNETFVYPNQDEQSEEYSYLLNKCREIVKQKMMED